MRRKNHQRVFSNLQDEIAETNKQAGKEFLAENAKRSGVVVLPSGLQYEVLAEEKVVSRKLPIKFNVIIMEL